MSQIKVEIKGLDKLRRRFDTVLPALKTGIKAGTQHVEGKVKSYPPQTMANKPKTYQTGANNTWYQRGWGGKWAIKAGGWHGKKSSEQLQQRWTTKMRNSGLTGVIGNNASYAKYVQGTKQEQAKALEAIGWKGVDTIAEEETVTVNNFIQNEIDRALG